MCICSLRFPSCNAHVPYCHLCLAPIYTIFPRYLIKGTILEKKITEYKICVLIFSATFVWNISHFKKKWAKYDNKFYISLTVHHVMILGKLPTCCTNFFYVFISIYNSLHISSTSCSSSGETNFINTASGNSHSMLVAEMFAGWKKPSSNLHRSLPPT